MYRSRKSGASGRALLYGFFVLQFYCALGRVRTRRAAPSRAHRFLDVGDVPLDGLRRDEVFFAGGGLDLSAIKVSACAVFLQTARWAREAGGRIAVGLVDREGVCGFVEGRAGLKNLNRTLSGVSA